MKTDCKYMEKRFHDLELMYDEAMLKKFGTKVDLNKLQEDILRKMVFTIRADVTQMQIEYKNKAIELKVSPNVFIAF